MIRISLQKGKTICLYIFKPPTLLMYAYVCIYPLKLAYKGPIVYLVSNHVWKTKSSLYIYVCVFVCVYMYISVYRF
jgi:hypothetical protein